MTRTQELAPQENFAAASNGRFSKNVASIGGGQKWWSAYSGPEYCATRDEGNFRFWRELGAARDPLNSERSITRRLKRRGITML